MLELEEQFILTESLLPYLSCWKELTPTQRHKMLNVLGRFNLLVPYKSEHVDTASIVQNSEARW